MVFFSTFNTIHFFWIEFESGILEQFLPVQQEEFIVMIYWSMYG